MDGIAELKTALDEGNKTIDRTLTQLRSEVEGIKGTVDGLDKAKITKIEGDLAVALKQKQDDALLLKAMEKRLDEVETKSNRPGSPKALEAQAEEHKAAFLNYARKGQNGGAMQALYDIEQKAADVRTSTGAFGGFALPKELADSVYKVLLDISPIRAISKVVTTGTTDYHQIVNRGGLAAEWVGETTTRTQPTATPDFADVAPTFGEMSATPEATRHSMNDLFFWSPTLQSVSPSPKASPSFRATASASQPGS
jgi:HK97 family phage major capsid protein